MTSEVVVLRRVIRYRKIVWVFVLLFIIVGLFTYLQTPKRDIPEIEQHMASVSVAYPGANPETVEKTIANPIEEEVVDLAGIDQVNSTSTNGFANVTISLADQTDTEAVYAIIRQTVQDVQQDFPDEVVSTTVDTDLVSSSVATYHLQSDDREKLLQLREQLTNWEDTLTTIPGVQSISIKGLPEQKVVVSLQQEDLMASQLQPNQVIEAIQQATSPSPLGVEKNEEQQILLHVEEVNQFDQLGEIYLPGANEASLQLSDVATISVEEEPLEDLITVGNHAALSITVFAEDGTDITSLQDNIDQQIEELTQELPDHISTEKYYSQSQIIDEVYRSLLISFVLSFISVIIIMVLGLPLFSAILVALAIPVSILIGLIPMPYAGVDLNQISIIGIIVAIGILVDDAIVMNDNIMRRYQLGDGPVAGIQKGAREVRISIITSTLLIIFSFFPLTFLSGSNGDFIRALPIALMGSIIASTLVALTVIPTLQYVRKKAKGREKKPKTGLLAHFFEWIANRYADKILPNMIKKPWLTTILGFLICILLILLVFKVPFEFFPSADREEVTLSFTLDEGTPIAATDEKLAEIEAYIQEETDHVKETVRYTGGGLPNIFNSALNRSGENTGQIAIRIDRDHTSAAAYISDYQQSLRETFPDGDLFLETIVSGPPPSAALELKLKGPDLATLLEKSTLLSEQLNELDTVEIATRNTGSSQPVKTYQIDQNFLAEQQIPLNQITGTLQLANAAIPLTEIQVDNHRLDMELILDEGETDGIDLESLNAVAPNQGEVFRYDSFISSHTEEQMAAITHENGERTITVSVYEAEGNQHFHSETETVIEDIRNQLGPEYQLVTDGEASAETAFFVEVAKLFIIVLFLIYITLAIQFNSLLTPVLIASTIFLAITGAIVGLFISGQPLSFLAVLGIVSLSGVVVRNSIIIIEFIEQNKDVYQGDLTRSVIEAGRARIRPIILTALTSIAALTPIIIMGDVLFTPLAVSIVAGIIFSTVLTLLLLPAMYIATKQRSRTRKVSDQ